MPVHHEIETNPIAPFHIQLVGRNSSEKLKKLQLELDNLQNQMDSLEHSLSPEPPEELYRITKERTENLAKQAELLPKLDAKKAEYRKAQQEAGVDFTAEWQFFRPGLVRSVGRPVKRLSPDETAKKKSCWRT